MLTLIRSKMRVAWRFKIN